MKVEDFFEGMAKVATTVNVVTTDGAAGKGGLTVSAMSSVSADPPTLLVCIHSASHSCELIKTNRKFCVNVLRASQTALSETFAGRSMDADARHFDSDVWHISKLGSPLLHNALVSFDCLVTQYLVVGSHTVFFGEIHETFKSDGEALIYVNRNYQKE